MSQLRVDSVAWKMKNNYLFLILSVILFCGSVVSGLGVNYGTMASHLLPPKVVAGMLKANNITKVKLFDADFNVVRAFAGTDIEVMVAIPNDMLQTVAYSLQAAERWVKRNVTRYLFDGGVKIRYVAVGNEPFLKAYNGSFQNVTLPALTNIQQALANAKVADKVKVTCPLNADVLSNGGSALPSAGVFRPDIHDLMTQLVTFLNKNQCPFTINLYPFLSLQQDPNFPKEFAFFDGASTPITDGENVYTNVFDASYDLLVAAFHKAGIPDMPILVGEVGWPTDGDENADVGNAQRFYQELLKHILKGTPLRPGQPIEVYMFSLTDEDQKSIAPGNFERHWGVYTFDGQAKYPVDLTGNGENSTLVNAANVDYLPQKWCVLNPGGDRTNLADNVGYACTYADCTPLSYGGSCNGIGIEGNASFAFNSYFQTKNQEGNSCNFEGLGMVTNVDPSQGNCKFIIGIAPSHGVSSVVSVSFSFRVCLLVMCLTMLLL